VVEITDVNGSVVTVQAASIKAVTQEMNGQLGTVLIDVYGELVVSADEAKKVKEQWEKDTV
jgi:hypothetical protein